MKNKNVVLKAFTNYSLPLGNQNFQEINAILFFKKNVMMYSRLMYFSIDHCKAHKSTPIKSNDTYRISIDIQFVIKSALLAKNE